MERARPAGRKRVLRAEVSAIEAIEAQLADGAILTPHERDKIAAKAELCDELERIAVRARRVASEAALQAEEDARTGE